MLRPAKWSPIFGAGQAIRGTETKYFRSESSRIFASPHMGQAGSKDQKRRQQIGLLAKSIFRPSRSIIEPSGTKVTEGDDGHKLRLRRVEGAQALGTQDVRDSQLEFSQQYLHRAAIKPRQRAICVERQRAGDKDGSGVEIVGKKGERVPANGEHERVVSSKLKGSTSEPQSFGNFLRGICQPAILHP